ncbi:hypothetical protein S14_165 [Shewanella sp. phage 1/4]|nr:hypothetical protein S14_165 [Shewanella sp. phage 1/4]AHK11274.1 hypothetical protein S14_165 [Shewanella sp. phage 1/4]
MTFYKKYRGKWVEIQKQDLVIGTTYKTVYEGGWYIIAIHNPISGE